MKKIIFLILSSMLLAQTTIDIYNKNIALIKDDVNIAVNNNKGYIFNIPKKIILDSIYFKNDKNIKSFAAEDGMIYLETLNDSDFIKTKMSYLTKGINYKVNYLLDLNRYGKLIGYCEIINNTKIDFKDAKVNLMGADINLQNYIYPTIKASYKYENIPKKMPIEISGYYKYEIPYIINIRKYSSKIYKFLSIDKIEYKKKYIVNLYDSIRNFGTKMYKFYQYIYFKVPKQLIGGKINIFKKDSFLGEDYIKNSSKNSEIVLKIGKDFDLELKRVQIFYKKDKKKMISKIKFIIKNPKNKKVRVFVDDHFNNSNAKIEIDKNVKFIKIDSNTIRYIVDLPKNYTFEFIATYIIPY